METKKVKSLSTDTVLEPENNISYFKNDNIGLILLMILILILSIMFLLLIILPDKEISERENRTLATFPKFSFSSYFSGEFNSGIDSYCSDTFPFRDGFLDINSKITKLTSQFSSGGDDAIVVIQTGDRDMGGEGFGDFEEYESQSNSGEEVGN